MNSYPQYELILDHIGGFGRYQCLLFVWYQLGIWVVVAHMGFMIFGGWTPTCQQDILNINNTIINSTCETEFYSLVNEWNLVDDLSYVPKFITSMQMVGVLLGALIGGQLSDRYGRRLIYVLFFSIVVASGFGSLLCTGWVSYCASRVVVGVGLGCAIGAQYVLAQECISPKWRLITVVGNWPLGWIVLGVQGLVTGDWRWLTVSSNAVGVVQLLVTFLIHESPKWLIETGKSRRALKSLKNIARLNGRGKAQDFQSEKHLRDAVLHQHTENYQCQVEERSTVVKLRKNYTYWHLFTFGNGRTALQIIVLLFSWFVTSLCNYGLLFNMGALWGNAAINTIIFGALRVAVCTPLPFIDRFWTAFGRKMMHSIGLVGFCSCLLALTILFHTEYHKMYPILVNVFSLTGLMMCSFIWAAIQVYACELFPTVLRNMGMGLCHVFARIGTVVAPLTMLMNDYHNYELYLGLLTFNALCVTFILPETKGKPLPEISDPMT